MESIMKKIMGDLTCPDLNNITLQDDEYIKDDNVYCKKCNTHRSLDIEVFERVRKVRCMCQCQKEKMEREQMIEKQKEKMARLSRLQDNSLMGEKYRNAFFDNSMKVQNESLLNAYKRCYKYCENADEVLKNGYGLYIVGNPGVGKTHLTACMANELIKRYKEVLFTNFFEISKSIRSTFNGKGDESTLLNKIANVEFLFIDDLGTESLSKNDGDNFLQDKIFEIINARYNNNKPTIFTSNNTMKQLITERNFAPKTVDRISEMSTVVLKIEGESYRGKLRASTLPF